MSIFAPEFRFGGVQLTPPILGNAAITELGTIGFGSEYLPLGGGPCCAFAFFLGDSIIAKSGDTVDGYMLTIDDPLAPVLTLQLNASGKALFQSLAVTPSGGLTAGWFTPEHSIVVSGDNLAGYTVANGFEPPCFDKRPWAHCSPSHGFIRGIARYRNHRRETKTEVRTSAVLNTPIFPNFVATCL